MYIGTGSIKSRMGSPKSPVLDTPIARPTTELVGEIDTRAPFQSVKAAVTIFGEGTTSNSNPQLFTPKIKRQTTFSEERVLEKETQLLLALKEVDNYKQRLRSAEISKTQATRELQKANTTLHELQQMVGAVNQSRRTTIEATQLSNDLMARHLKHGTDHDHDHGGPANFKHVLDNVRENYKLCSADLIAAKQELTKIKQDFDVASLKKLAAFKKMTDAQQQNEANFERLKKLTNEVETVKESLNQVKLASLQTREEHAKAVLEKESKLNYLKQSKKEKDNKLLALREEARHLQGGGEEEEDLKEALRETTQGIVVLQEQLKNAGQTNDLESLRMKKLLQGMEEEEDSIRSLVNSLKAELEGRVQENSKLSNKAKESESIADSMKAELERTKAQLAEVVALQATETNEDYSSVETHSKIQRLLQEAENARQEAEETIRNAKELNREAENGRNKEMEEELEVAQKEAILAKAAEKVVGDRIHEASSPKSEAHSKKRGMIRISANEFRSLREKAEEFRRISAEKERSHRMDG